MQTQDIKISKRTNSRLYAVQAIYQFSNTFDKQENILDKYVNRSEISLTEEIHTNKFDLELFKILFNNTTKNIEEIDATLIACIKETWSIERLSAVLLSILRVGISEILYSDTPSSVIINEYINIAKSFTETESTKMVNGILHKICDSSRKASLSE